MFNLERGAFPLRIGIALAAALLLGVVTPASACISCAAGAPPNTDDDGTTLTTADGRGPISPCSTPPTVAECRAAWDESSAQSTCRNPPEIYVYGNDCMISALCSTDTSSWFTSPAEITECVDDIPDLNNCDGNFQIGAC